MRMCENWKFLWLPKKVGNGWFWLTEVQVITREDSVTYRISRGHRIYTTIEWLYEVDREVSHQ
jgi:hypothetical protein